MTSLGSLLRSRSIWVLGIEPGWSLTDQAADERGDASDIEQLRQYGVNLQLKWPYNRNAFKLLAALGGTSPEDYRHFAAQAHPFERGSTGYFKGNLFPEPFNKVGSWDAAATEATGFASKDEYRSWLRAARFAVFRLWIQKCRPKLVIGTSLTHLRDFLAITETPEMPSAHRFEVNGKPKRLHVATSGIVPVAVIPHLTGGPHGLNSHQATQIAADRILAVLRL